MRFRALRPMPLELLLLWAHTVPSESKRKGRQSEGWGAAGQSWRGQEAAMRVGGEDYYTVQHAVYWTGLDGLAAEWSGMGGGTESVALELLSLRATNERTNERAMQGRVLCADRHAADSQAGKQAGWRAWGRQAGWSAVLDGWFIYLCQVQVQVGSGTLDPKKWPALRQPANSMCY